jgi:hypothetical protein
VATRGGTVLTSMSQPSAQRCAHDPVPGLSLDCCLIRPGDIDPQNVRAANGSDSKGLGGRRRAPRSCSVNPPRSPLRGAPVPQSQALPDQASAAAVSGFGCDPGLSPGVARDGDDARSAATSASSPRYAKKCTERAPIQTSDARNDRCEVAESEKTSRSPRSAGSRHGRPTAASVRRLTGRRRTRRRWPLEKSTQLEQRASRRTIPWFKRWSCPVLPRSGSPARLQLAALTGAWANSGGSPRRSSSRTIRAVPEAHGQGGIELPKLP